MSGRKPGLKMFGSGGMVSQFSHVPFMASQNQFQERFKMLFGSSEELG